MGSVAGVAAVGEQPWVWLTWELGIRNMMDCMTREWEEEAKWQIAPHLG